MLWCAVHFDRWADDNVLKVHIGLHMGGYDLHALLQLGSMLNGIGTSGTERLLESFNNLNSR